MHTPSIDQIKRALHLSETIASLQKEVASVIGRAGAKVLGVVESGLKSATRGIKNIKVKRVPKPGRGRKTTAPPLRSRRKRKEIGPLAKTRLDRKAIKLPAGKSPSAAIQKARMANVRKSKAVAL